MSNAEIVVPKEKAIEELNRRLTVLQDQARAIKVTDQPTYVQAAGIRTSFKAYIDAVKFQTRPEIVATKEKLDRLKQDESVLLSPAEAEVKALDDKIVSWREEEKRQARVEQDRKNAELARQAQEKADADRRESERIAAETQKRKMAEIKHLLDTGKIGKREAARQLKAAGLFAQAAIEEAAAAHEEAKNAPPPTVTVKPNVPTVAGAPKNQVYYSARLVSPEKLWVAFAAAIRSDNSERAAFLSRFFEVSESALAKYARETKDNERASEAVPGVEFTSRG